MANTEVCWHCGRVIPFQNAFEIQEDIFICDECLKAAQREIDT